MTNVKQATPEEVAEMIHAGIEAKERANPRSQQSRDGILGPSDIGFCRNKALLTLKQVEPTNERSMWPAQVGTAVGDYIESGLKIAHPEWIIGSIDKVKVTARLRSGTTITGTPDVIAPDLNGVIDLKSRNGLKLVERAGSSLNEVYQKWLYTKGAVDDGLLDGSKPLWYGNAYVDRSGADPELVVVWEEFDPMLEDAIEQWIADVIYARLHDEEASKDIPAPRCESMCEFFDVCRGGVLPDSDGGEVIEDPLLIEAVRMYEEGKTLEAKGKKLKSEAAAALANVSGVAPVGDEDFQVRWTYVNPYNVAAREQNGYFKIDVRRLKRVT